MGLIASVGLCFILYLYFTFPLTLHYISITQMNNEWLKCRKQFLYTNCKKKYYNIWHFCKQQSMENWQDMRFILSMARLRIAKPESCLFQFVFCLKMHEVIRMSIQKNGCIFAIIVLFELEKNKYSWEYIFIYPRVGPKQLNCVCVCVEEIQVENFIGSHKQLHQQKKI